MLQRKIIKHRGSMYINVNVLSLQQISYEVFDCTARSRNIDAEVQSYLQSKYVLICVKQTAGSKLHELQNEKQRLKEKLAYKKGTILNICDSKVKRTIFKIINPI